MKTLKILMNIVNILLLIIFVGFLAGGLISLFFIIGETVKIILG